MAKTIVDFTDVESSGGRVRVPEDDYRAKVLSVKQETAKSGNEMLVWEFEIRSGDKKAKGKKIKDYTVLQANSLWKLKGLLEAIGVSVPQKKLDILPILKKVKGKELGITVIDEEYENKISSKVSDYLDLDALESTDDEDDESDEDDDEDDDDDEPTPKKSKKGKKKSKKNEDDDDIEELDLDDL